VPFSMQRSMKREFVHGKMSAIDEEYLKYVTGYSILSKETEVERWLNLFLLRFGTYRFLIIRNNNRRAIIRALKKFCSEASLEMSILDARKLNVDDIKGKYVTIHSQYDPATCIRKPYYISGNRQMIIIEHVDSNTGMDILRAFWYVGSLEAYYSVIEELPEDKLPNGSGFVFLANSKFPYERFRSISDYWVEEARSIDLRDFRTRAIDHMAKYKEEVMQIKGKGVYKHRGRNLQYDHILPEDLKRHNILESFRNDFWDYAKPARISLHRDFSHLNSSQAACFNFFYPLLKQHKLDIITNMLGLSGEIDYDTITFEKVSELEDTVSTRTRFDFYMQLKTGVKIFFEIKYSENGFGKATKDDAHMKKFSNVYFPLIRNRDEFKETLTDLEMAKGYFLENYQILRNIVHIDKNSYVVFIYPEHNIKIGEEIKSIRKEAIKESWANHCVVTTWEKVCAHLVMHLEEAKEDSRLADYYREDFGKKYLFNWH